jgi:hypothetical protein
MNEVPVSFILNNIFEFCWRIVSILKNVVCFEVVMPRCSLCISFILR